MNRNTWSTGTAVVSFEVLAPGFKALTIVLPTVVSVSVNVSRRGRFAGFAPNIHGSLHLVSFLLMQFQITESKSIITI